ncbi:type IV pilus assembly protein PilM [Gimesia fumaroli]|jgi:type IV pilus assembly protein PilM|uniref:Competence protein A n=1 Tax=Gimesia fumaroli TaxID=2527976 RepID=A0A518ICN9_9PLAN|nr:type IV pilus assembly protein PilM [Gimesia fumaroli]QDV50800.1 Competence protein A [Gimesia fumaroli]
MAENQAVWGIEIGQAGLKAIRLRYAEAADQVIAVAFDYIPHPKILSQPDAVPDELISQALDTFLSRNETKDDLIAISVPGQTSLARFIQLPPVQSSRVPEIVKYEAKQQIPFALEDVIWDYQPLGGGVEESGYMLDAEVGIFAMKRDQVLKTLQPFVDRKIEVELIQIAPLGLYNTLCYDSLGMRVGEEFEGNPEESAIVVDMGADSTTLMVTNGNKIWIRNVPIGGNHFTRALTKEMKLTFAKAEHLKCNATRSEDPRAVFQALRPVFNEYVSEIQRSIGYFSSVNRDAKISKVYGTGNGFKLAGLQKFLQQNLQYEVERLDDFQSLVGDAVLNEPLFQDNILTFTVPYGIALQALQRTSIRTTLLPPEIATARKIRRKKPWAVVTAAALLVGLCISTVGFSNVANSVSTDRFGSVESKVKNLTTQISGYQTSYSNAEGEFKGLLEKGDKLVWNLDTRDDWLEVYKAIDECLPRDVDDELDNEQIEKRNRIKLPGITVEHYSDLSQWFEKLTPQAKLLLPKIDQENPPEGEGFVFTLKGVHYHHDESQGNAHIGVLYVHETLMKNLQSWTVKNQDSAPVDVRKMGITHATVLTDSRDPFKFYPNGRPRGMQRGGEGRFAGPGGFGGLGAGPMPDVGFAEAAGGIPRRPRVGANRPEKEPKVMVIQRTTFELQFVWKPIPVLERQENPPESPTSEGEEATAEAG